MRRFEECGRHFWALGRVFWTLLARRSFSTPCPTPQVENHARKIGDMAAEDVDNRMRCFFHKGCVCAVDLGEDFIASCGADMAVRPGSAMRNPSCSLE